MAFEISTASAKERSPSRIEQDVNLVKSMTEQANRTTERIVAHARALGYFEPPSPSKMDSAPTPVITTMSDALQALSRAIDHCYGSLNVFD